MEKGMYEENGIGLSKSAPRVGDQVDIMYRGLLKESGAKNVKLHFGYNDTWEDSQYIEMNLSDNIFMATVPILKEGTLNFAFTDPVGNWDNNSGANYSIPIGGTRSRRGRPPLTGPYDKKNTEEGTGRVAAAADGEAAAPVKKRGRSAAKAEKETAAMKKAEGSRASRSAGSRARATAEEDRKAGAVMPEQALGTGKTTRGRRKAVQTVSEIPPAPRARGAGRKTKKEP